MTYLEELAELRIATTALLSAVNVKKVTLDAAVQDALEWAEKAAASAELALGVYGTNGQMEARLLEAAGYAAAALDKLNEFKVRDYGPLAADPLLDPLGNPLTIGAEYFNTTTNTKRVYRTGGWIDFEADALASKIASALSAVASAASAAASEISRQASDVSATTATNAKVAAEAARDSLNTTGKVFTAAEHTAGTSISGTTSGQQFAVLAADLLSYGIWRNNAGVAQSLSSIYTKAYLDSIVLKGTHARSGYVGGIITALGKIGVAFRKSDMRPIFGNGGDVVGRVEAVEAAQAAAVAAALAYTSTLRVGYTHAWITPAGRLPLYADRRGRIIATGRDFLAEIDSISTQIAANTALSTSAVAALYPSKDITLHGDSQTAGAGPTPWRTVLAGLISARNFRSLAVGGWNSTHIACRFAAVFPLVTLDGNLIPATAIPVSITSNRVYTVSGTLTGFTPLSSQGPQTLPATIMGVPGVFARVSEGVFTFTRDVAGTAMVVQPDAPVTFTRTAGYDANLMTICVGRNNTSDGATVQRDTLRLSQSQSTIYKRQIILPWTNGGAYTAGAAPTEGVGTAVGDACVAYEQWCENTFVDPGIVVLNIRKYSWQFGDGSADDNADIAAGTVPRSLRIDAVHYTAFFHQKIAELIASVINARGW